MVLVLVVVIIVVAVVGGEGSGVVAAAPAPGTSADSTSPAERASRWDVGVAGVFSAGVWCLLLAVSRDTIEKKNSSFPRPG